MVRLTTIAAGTTGRLRAGVIRIDRVGTAVRFVGVGSGEINQSLAILWFYSCKCGFLHHLF